MRSTVQFGSLRSRSLAWIAITRLDHRVGVTPLVLVNTLRN